MRSAVPTANLTVRVREVGGSNPLAPTFANQRPQGSSPAPSLRSRVRNQPETAPTADPKDHTASGSRKALLSLPALSRRYPHWSARTGGHIPADPCEGYVDLIPGPRRAVQRNWLREAGLSEPSQGCFRPRSTAPARRLHPPVGRGVKDVGRPAQQTRRGGS